MSSSSSLSSLLSGLLGSGSSSANTVTPLTFSGQSTYSADFQQIIDRAVEVQSINLNNLNNIQSTDQSQLAALQSLDSVLSTFNNAISTLASSIGQSSYTATVGNTAVANATVTSGATAGQYTLEIDSTGSYTQTVSADGLTTVTDPSTQNISSSSSFTLTVDGVATTITPSSNTLQGLVNAINANSSLGVTASMVNVGSSSSPDYRLSLQSSKLGSATIQLSDGVNNSLLNTISTGTLASYKVDGLATPITSDSDTVTLAPGVTVNLLGTTAPGNPTTITVSQSTGSTESALSNLATAYNAVVQQLAASHGQNANALSGDSILLAVKQSLESITSYSSSTGSIQTMADLGLTLDDSGNLNFDSSTFENTVSNNVGGLNTFLGDTTSGFIQAATNAVDSLEDPTSGMVKGEESQLNTSISDLGTKISDQINQINTFQQNLVAQLSAADATIYSLQNQESYFKQLFDTMNSNNTA